MEVNRMTDVYKNVMLGSAVTGGAVAAVYFTASAAAYSEGDGRQIAPPVNTFSIILIVCCAVIAGGAWLFRRGHADAAERHLRPVVRVEVKQLLTDSLPLVVRNEVEQALADSLPLVVATVAEAVAKRIDPALHTVATGAANRTAAVLREAVTADITDIVNGVYRRGQVAGAILHSQTTGRPPLHPVRQWVSTSEGD
jgi:hypothetical protein